LRRNRYFTICEYNIIVWSKLELKSLITIYLDLLSTFFKLKVRKILRNLVLHFQALSIKNTFFEFLTKKINII